MQGFPQRVFAPQRRLDSIGPVLRGWAVTRAARHVPFSAVCLPQAMAARIMLKRRGVDSVLHFGARIGQDKIGQDKPIDAHAWLDAAGVEVTGYPVANTFAEIACFV
jgi:hypothetical protein